MSEFVATIGAFDGVHQGHRALVAATLADARRRGMRAVGFTFSEDPAHVLASESAPPDLLGCADRARLLRSLGLDAVGIDLEPRGEAVERGDFLHAPYPDGSFDAVLSQCAFFVSGNRAGALREAHRLLRPGGLLLLSDVFFEEPTALLRAAGFEILKAEDMTHGWREYYLEALWRGEDCGCELPRGRCCYWLLIGRKD